MTVPVAPITYISSDFLDEIQKNILVRPIPWDGYVRAALLSNEDATLLKSIEKQPQVVEKKLEHVAQTFATLLHTISREDVVKYLLALTVTLLETVPQFSGALLALSEKDASLPYEPFVKFLDKSQDIHLLAVKNLVILFSLKEAPAPYVSTTLTFITSKLATPADTNLQDIAVQSLGLLLQSKWYRGLFWTASAERIPPLLTILAGSKTNIQLQYHTLLALWLLSFERLPAKELVTKFDIVPVYFDIIKNSVKEKTIRLAVALLVNAVTLAPKETVSSLLVNQGLTFIGTLSERKWADEELVADLETLKDTLQTAFDSMTTFDEYKNELESKKLRWSPPHRSEGFWRENAEEFKAHDWKVLKALVDIIKSGPTDPVVAAVAASDINRVFSIFPEAVKVVERIGGKVAIMELMNHPSDEVRYEALKATQTLISNTL